MKTKIFLFTASLCHVSIPLSATDKEQEQPNILWLTFEDTSSYEFGCYGNKHVRTPNIDSLAANGIQYMNAWSTAPQSSPARSSLITGCYATTYGMDIHPVAQLTPDHIFFPQWLREAGYYCTNNSKTHYNTTSDNKSCWDECSRKASYNSKNRKDGQPFFAVFNTVTSHMGRIRSFHTDGRRDYSKEGIEVEKLEIPPHVPDLVEVRSDYAGHLEAAQDVDTWVGFFLKDLKEKGLDDNTIIFVFSDHGGCLPRGKGYLYETGLRVPLIAYFPEKWKHLAPAETGTKDNSLIGFTDLAPSILSLAGIKPPEHMQGKALMGKFAVKEKKNIQFAFAANHLHHYTPVRAATDGRYKYIRSYMPYRQFALRNYYQWGMPSNQAWDRLVLENKNTNPVWEQPFKAHPAEMLFDLQSDPFELNDLSDKAEYSDILTKFRKETSHHIRQTKDLGFFIPTSRNQVNMYDKVRKEDYPLDELCSIAELAGTASEKDLSSFTKHLNNSANDLCFWAVAGISNLASKGLVKNCPTELIQLLDNADPYISAEAAYACAYSGEKEKAISHLIYPKEEKMRKANYSVLECLSLDKTMHEEIKKHADQLEWSARNLPHKENEDAGLMAAGILVNIGKMDIKDMYGTDAYEMGVTVNKGRRPMIPLP